LTNLDLLVASSKIAISNNAQYFFDNALTHLLPMIFPQGQRRHALRLHCHFDNCPVHFPKVSEQFFTENGNVHGLHPPYSPDLAASDSWFFGYMKVALAGHALDRREELLDVIRASPEAIQVSELKGFFQNWVE
jgi:hypothetical protein